MFKFRCCNDKVNKETVVFASKFVGWTWDVLSVYRCKNPRCSQVKGTIQHVNHGESSPEILLDKRELEPWLRRQDEIYKVNKERETRFRFYVGEWTQMIARDTAEIFKNVLKANLKV